MEASVAADGDGAAEAAPAGMDLSPVLSRLDEMGPRFEKLEAGLQGLLGPEESEDDGDEFDFAQLFGAEDDGEPEAQQQRALDPQALQALVDARTQQAIDSAMGPVMAQVRSIQTGLDAEQLAAKYPALARQEVAEPVVKAARELAEKVGKPELATDMGMLELIYKAQMADQYAAGEVPVGAEKGFDLERAGGAGPAQGDESNIAERVIAGAQKGAYWNF